MQRFFGALNGVVWGPPMLLLFIFTAIRFTVKSNFFQFTNFKYIFKTFIKSIIKKDTEPGISQFSAFCSVLGACIGTGNIVGVATAIYSGGPGVVFWMIVSAFFSMMIAYVENNLGAEYNIKYNYNERSFGAFSYIENGLKMKGLAKIYALLCFMSAIGMGNMTQSNSLADSLKVTFNIPVIISGISVSVIGFIIIRGGLKRIANLQTYIVPITTIFYFVISFAVLYKCKENILPSMKMIITQAFSLRAIKGFNMYKAIRFGVSRGIFSNEAGLGSSTILHAQVKNQKPETQGISAMMEVFIDTIIMCSLTALVILVSTDVFKTELFGAQLSLKAYSAIGLTGKYGVGILTAVFAFMSMISCSFYGEMSLRYLLGKKGIHTYKLVYAFLIFVGCVTSPKIIWEFADICNGLMAIPNLFALNCLWREVTPFGHSKSRALCLQ